MKKEYILLTVVVFIMCILLLLLCFKNNDKKAVTKEIAISESIVYLQPGKEYKLSYSDYSNGNTNYTFESSNPNIATVDSTGKVEAVSSGKVTIRAVDTATNTVYDNCEIVVEGEKKQDTKKTTTKTKTDNSVSIYLNKTELPIEEGQTEKLLVSYSSSSAPSEIITWSSDDDSIAIVNDGVVTAKKAGTAIITAKSASGSIATCKVTVIEKSVKTTGIRINADKKLVYVGSTLNLTVTIYPSDATDNNISWSSSDESIATVSNGVVTGLRTGSVTITAKSYNGKEATIKISVLDNGDEISSIKINTNGTSLKVGDSITLVATIQPGYATDKSVTWSSSDSSVASVSSTGVVTAKKLGTAIITARSSNGKESTCKISVVSNSVEITSLKLNKAKAEVKVGEKVELYGIISPSNATNQKLTWTSSNESIATVSYGTVKTLKAGTVTITAKSNNGLVATCTITIKEPSKPVTKITISKSFISLYVGQTEKVTAILSPSDADDKSVTWYSENTQIATVSSDGTIKAISKGTVEISAKSSNGKVATMKVMVQTGITKISLNKTSTTLEVGKNETLVATITPSDAYDKSVIWETSDSSIVSVTRGVITAKKVGTATITAKSVDGKVATCTVVVKNPDIPVTSIKLNSSSETIKVGESVAFVATITPGNATDKTVSWSSSDSNIATISNTGVVTGKKAGTVTITAKSSNGKVATAKVTVKSNYYLTLDKTSIVCEVGESVVVTVNSSSKIKSYTSSNNRIAKVSYKDSNKYTINCSATGVATVKFVGNDGASAIANVHVKKKTTSYNIAKDKQFEKYQQVATCDSSTMSYRIIKINSNYYTLVWMENVNRQINNALARSNAVGVSSVEEIFEYPSKPQKCFVGINGSFFSGSSPSSNVVLAEGKVAKNKGKSAAIIGINSKGDLTFYRDKTAQELLSDGVRNTWKISSHVSADNSSAVTNRTQIFQYDSNNYILYIGNGTVKSGLTNVQKLFPSITEGFNLDGGGSSKLYYRTKTSALIKAFGGTRQIPDTLYITE